MMEGEFAELKEKADMKGKVVKNLKKKYRGALQEI